MNSLFEFLKKFQTVEVKEYPNQVKPEPLVSVCVQTYQHVNFIEECLDGILMQKTTFDFEILLGEDESTDGTREISLKYAEKHEDKIRLFLHSRENVIRISGNPTGRFNLLYNFNKARGKYIAICEGDDYWTEPNKLQEQVDFLENNSEYTLCVHNAKYLFQNNLHKSALFNINLKKGKFSTENIVELPWFIPTASMLIRKEAMSIPKWIYFVQQGDLAIALILSLKGPIHYMDKAMSIYRINLHNLSNQSKLHESYLSQLELFSYFDMFTNFNFHDIIIKRKKLINKSLYYGFLKNSGKFMKYLNLDYYILKISRILYK